MSRDPQTTEDMPINDFSKLKISNGVIHYKLYRQDGSMQEMDCADNMDNRLCISWIQKFDRYTKHGDKDARI